MRTLCMAGLVASAVSAPASAAIITQWDFNAFPASGALVAPGPSIGVGASSSIALTGATPTTGSSGSGSSDPTQPGTAWNSSGYAAQGTNDNGSGLQFMASTLGVTDGIFVSFDVRASNTASKYIRLMYTLDGSTFTSAGLAGGGIYEILTPTFFNNGVTFDLTSIAGASNNANFGIRIVSTFAPTTSAYVAAAAGSNYGTSGTLRYDMVTVFTPTPGAIFLGGVAAIASRRRRR